ncbi:MAG: hypothetical protein IT449_03875 [Phycisphaerales bacterium]|nr:hypothetical protein [Phycisphaerales bacterium]
MTPPALLPTRRDREALFVGVDAGSSATKCVVIDVAGTLLSQSVVASGFDYAVAAEQALDAALRGIVPSLGGAFWNAPADPLGATGGCRDFPGTTGAKSISAAVAAACRGDEDEAVSALRADIARCVATGYGRANVRFAQSAVTEITCHARGAREWYPQVRAIIDVGGQDTKVIRINARGKLVDYRMNAKCAAGTGTFLESIALKLGVPLRTLDDLALTSTGRTVVNSYCTVFAGTEIIERIKNGEPRQDIALGLFRSIATRVGEMVGARDGAVAATGGVVAHCRAMVKVLEEVLGASVLLPPLPQQAGAYGAALLAREAQWDDVSEDPGAGRRMPGRSACHECSSQG